MDRNIVRPFCSDLPGGHMPIAPPEHVPRGIYLHYLNGAGLPVLAEGVIPLRDAERNRAAQAAVSGKYNELEKNIVHASHMIPRQFGGSGESYNLIALPKQCNLGRMRDFERELEALTRGRELYLQVFARYIGTQQMASDVLYRVFEMKQGKAQGLLRKQPIVILH